MMNNIIVKILNFFLRRRNLVIIKKVCKNGELIPLIQGRPEGEVLYRCYVIKYLSNPFTQDMEFQLTSWKKK